MQYVRRTICILFLTLLVVGVPASAYAGQLYVQVFGSDTAGDGSITNPFATVQHAVNAAASGDTVNVGMGTYTGNITMASGVSIRGAGQNVTTLRGTGSGSVVTATSIGADTSLAGVTITGGNRTGDGGGISLSGSDITISDTAVLGNSATVNGGGIACETYSSPTITNVLVLNNKATSDGGGIFCYQSTPLIATDTVMANTSGDDGAGIACETDASATIASTTIVRNVAGAGSTNCGGGIYCSGSADATITESTIDGNTAGSGAGVACLGSAAKLEANEIAVNQASHYGGGVYWDTTAGRVDSNTFVGNNAVQYGGGICASSTASPLPVVNNVLAANTAATAGGAIFDYNCGVVATNNTITGNMAVTGGAVRHSTGTTPTITNCIIWKNGDDLSNCSATYSDLSTGTIVPGDGNIKQDPLFADAAHGDFQLSLGSPCLDAATDTVAPDVDKVGNSRPQGIGLDMGAYELSAYVITPSAGTGGAISPDQPVGLYEGDSATFTITPDDGYELYDVQVDGVSVGTSSTVAFSKIADDHTISAIFRPVYQTTLTMAGGNSVVAKKSYRVTGTIRPAWITGNVQLTWSRLLKGKYVTVKTVSPVISAGNFSASYKPTIKGKWRAYVSYAGKSSASAVYLPAVKVYKAFTVK